VNHPSLALAPTADAEAVIAAALSYMLGRAELTGTQWR
jgi:hypothetical protein